MAIEMPFVAMKATNILASFWGSFLANFLNCRAI